MPRSNKPIVLICGSRNINYINLDLYINPDSVGAIVSGGANGVDILAEEWAKKHNIEFVAYLPDYKHYGKRAPLVRDEEMVNFCDVVIAFWNGYSTGTLYTCNYAKKMGRKVYLHIIEER